MKILLIGCGGREHAMAWKIKQSPLCAHLYTAPGNPGTAECGENVDLDIMDNPAVAAFCLQNKIDLVMVGPEVPLANGIVDDLKRSGIAAFGPVQDAAQLESSKPFSKDFMRKFNIPTAEYAVFSDAKQAKEHISRINYDFVIKAGGLTAGKGVYLPESLEEARQIIDSIMLEKQFGEAGNEIIVEERLQGPEISLMAFADGNTAVAMIPVQDHKRLLDGQKGPNTGGMGAYAPVPFCSKHDIQSMMENIILPAVNGMKELGTPYLGILYAGLMLTDQGPKVLEFNCRFGDPETQVVLPLLASDLVQIALDCISGKLATASVAWKEQSAVTVVVASANYPGQIHKGIQINLPQNENQHEIIFHAGTAMQKGKLVTAGGRVLNITGIGEDLPKAINTAYQTVSNVHFDGMQYRTDIGKGASLND
ncbi:MAG: phosphoribosylamine--glycine ligase [Anaerolineaceae bacterium]|nr:phosphoribosylamine--glycine ligase [Anaerolineaceae bacterium]